MLRTLTTISGASEANSFAMDAVNASGGPRSPDAVLHPRKIKRARRSTFPCPSVHSVVPLTAESFSSNFSFAAHGPTLRLFPRPWRKLFWTGRKPGSKVRRVALHHVNEGAE